MARGSHRSFLLFEDDISNQVWRYSSWERGYGNSDPWPKPFVPHPVKV